MKEDIRLFVATQVSEDMKHLLQKQVSVYEHLAARLLPIQNLHLTLFFVGNIPVADLEKTKSLLQQIAPEHEAFNLLFLCTEPGPNRNAPRLIWARFEEHSAFEKLQKSIAAALSPAQKLKQKPIPHITLARFRKEVPAPTDLPAIKFETSIGLQVNTLSLWQSELASPHPVYSVLETYQLAAKP